MTDEDKKNYDALRNMFLHPPVYLPPVNPLGQSIEPNSLVQGMSRHAPSGNLMLGGHPFLPGGLPMIPYDFAYLPFPAASAALEGTSHAGSSMSESANFWAGLYPFAMDPFLAEAMKMNLTPYLAAAEGAGKDNRKPYPSGAKERERKFSTAPSPKHDASKIDAKKRSFERSASSHSESSTSSHDRQTPGSKSPAASTSRVTSSPIKHERVTPLAPAPPLIKTPPLAHERKRKRPDSVHFEQALDFSAKSRPIQKSMNLKIDSEYHSRVKISRGAPNFGDVEWLSNPDSTPKKKSADRNNTETTFINDPILRGEALQVRIAQYNVSQLRSRLDMNLDNSWTARIEPDFSDLGYSVHKDEKERKEHPVTSNSAADRLASGSPRSAFDLVEQKRSRDSVIVSRPLEAKSFSERMSDIARKHAALEKAKDAAMDLRGTHTSSKKRVTSSLPLVGTRPKESKGGDVTLKDSVDTILDTILNDYAKTEGESDVSKPENDPNSVSICDTSSTSNGDEKVDGSPLKNNHSENRSGEQIIESRTPSKEVQSISSFLPLSEVLSTAISSEFARTQSGESNIPSVPSKGETITSNIPRDSDNGDLEAPSAVLPTVDKAGQFGPQCCDDNPYMSIANIIDRLEQDDDDDKESNAKKEHCEPQEPCEGGKTAMKTPAPSSLDKAVEGSLKEPLIPPSSATIGCRQNSAYTEHCVNDLPLLSQPDVKCVENSTTTLAGESLCLKNVPIGNGMPTIFDHRNDNQLDYSAQTLSQSQADEEVDILQTVNVDGNIIDASNGTLCGTVDSGHEATKLVLVKDPKNGYAVKSNHRELAGKTLDLGNKLDTRTTKADGVAKVVPALVDDGQTNGETDVESTVNVVNVVNVNGDVTPDEVDNKTGIS